MTRAQPLGAGQGAVVELREDRLVVQRRVVDLAREPDVELGAQVLLEQRAVDALGQERDVLVEVAARRLRDRERAEIERRERGVVARGQRPGAAR